MKMLEARDGAGAGWRQRAAMRGRRAFIGEGSDSTGSEKDLRLVHGSGARANNRPQCENKTIVDSLRNFRHCFAIVFFYF